FTLVELLVVISIIAILSVIGITVFTGVQKNARDAKRRGDIDAISQAMEVHYGASESLAQGPYPYLRDSWFASGSIPKDPQSGQSSCNGLICRYCDRSASSDTWDIVAPAGPGLCGGTGDKGEVQAANAPGPPAYFGYNFGGYYTWVATRNYVVCANLESGGFYCKSNQQ
ncbi:MAG: type II secretion system protein, partial [Patescibacteria group bacterium]